MLQSAVGIYSVQVGMFFVIWIASDFFEFFYHQLGHRYKFLWEQVCRGHSGTCHITFAPGPLALTPWGKAVACVRVR